ncbi:Kinase-like protein [Stemphylium lycopersici]|uniref:Kinase-like protein n=1 Tax=Stemphylium lycopersici TaxID=183478 RepID=A0A364NCB1_STELY|nr:Kinase-like protein [Stemphylium lycopersici]
MADVEQKTPIEGTPVDDVEMGGGDATGAGEETLLPEIEPETPELVLFADLIKSPIVEVVVGSGESRTAYSAHEAVVRKSPEMAKQIENFAPGGPRQIVYADCDADAMGSVIEYLYTGEYFPKKTSAARDASLEKDPRQPTADNEGLGLLAHARIYTLADRLQLPELKSLAHSKIHRTASTAKGELAYARYVYKESDPEDATIRKPVAAFWATRSFSLRHGAEPEFKAMCLEFPQFSYDVLQLVLDQQEKKRGGDDGPTRSGPSVIPGSTRKRARLTPKVQVHVPRSSDGLILEDL